LRLKISAVISWFNNTLAPARARCFGNQKRRSSARTPKRKREMQQSENGHVLECIGAPPLSIKA
jgi:hypothetical protein